MEREGSKELSFSSLLLPLCKQYHRLDALAIVDYISITLICSLQQNYGRLFSMRLGSYKFLMASTPEAVKEVLVKKSADYAGRPQTYIFSTITLGW